MSDCEQRLRPALRYIRDNFRRSLTVPEIAAIVKLSAPHFGQVFYRYVGKTVNELVNEMRVAAAIRELRTSEKGIQQIAAEVGFTHRRHFTRVFRDLTGCAPREYRRQTGSIEPLYAHPLTRHVIGLTPRCQCGDRQLVCVQKELQCAKCGNPAKVADDINGAFEEDMLHLAAEPVLA